MWLQSPAPTFQGSHFCCPQKVTQGAELKYLSQCKQTKWAGLTQDPKHPRRARASADVPRARMRGERWDKISLKIPRLKGTEVQSPLTEKFSQKGQIPPDRYSESPQKLLSLALRGQQSPWGSPVSPSDTSSLHWPLCTSPPAAAPGGRPPQGGHGLSFQGCWGPSSGPSLTAPVSPLKQRTWHR